MESAVHYLVAVLGESDVPVSGDIGGLPQVIMDEADSDPGTPTGSVSIDIEDEVQTLEDSDNMDEKLHRQDLGRSPESLPSYNDVAEGCSSPPPSYDSLESLQTSMISTAAAERTKSVLPGMFAHKIRTRHRKKKGYHSHDT